MNKTAVIVCYLLITAFTSTTYSNYGDTTVTKWKIEPSLKYDACCFLNIMTGDEFYLNYYKDDYEKFKDKLTPDVKNALASLKKKVKDDNGTIISAWLCLYFSAVEDSTLEDILKTLQNPGTLRESFDQTPYASDEGWNLFLSVNSELKTIFSFLIDINFTEYWRQNVLPDVNKMIESVQPELPKYDVVKENEYLLGTKLPSDTITVYMLYFAKPHGIKITGTRFLTNVGWPIQIVIRTAGHEMMHPPYDYKNDEGIRNTIELFRQDDFVMDKVNNHNKSLGYNTLEGLFEEDCVQAMDQLIAEKFDMGKDPRKRWTESDEGIHVIAVALYQIIKDESYNQKNEKFRDFLIRIVREGKLVPGKIEEFHNKFYQ